MNRSNSLKAVTKYFFAWLYLLGANLFKTDKSQSILIIYLINGFDYWMLNDHQVYTQERTYFIIDETLREN